MADTVQLVLERMIPELEDLQARGIFGDVSARGLRARACSTPTHPPRPSLLRRR